MSVNKKYEKVDFSWRFRVATFAGKTDYSLCEGVYRYSLTNRKMLFEFFKTGSCENINRYVFGSHVEEIDHSVPTIAEIYLSLVVAYSGSGHGVFFSIASPGGLFGKIFDAICCGRFEEI